MSNLSTYCWLNGNIVLAHEASPSIASISFHMGTGVFDGVMAYWNNDHYYLHEVRAHFERLIIGAGHMGMSVDWTPDQLIEAVEQLLEREPNHTYYIRPIVYRGGPELWLTGSEGWPIDIAIFAVPVDRGNKSLISCEISLIERISSKAMPVHWKVCGLYVNSFLARKGAEKSGFNDGVMLDREGRIAEASAANIFFISGNNKVLTPHLNSDVFPGITRRTVFNICESLNIPVEEIDLYPEDINRMKGAFLSSTLMEIRLISRIGSTFFSYSNEMIFEQIVNEFSRITYQ